MIDPAKMATALARLYTARKARSEAHRSFSAYLNEAWGDAEYDDMGRLTYSPGWHRFGCCGIGQTANKHDEPVPILCEVCAGSAPFHATSVAAGREAGNALRQCQAIGRRIAEGKS